MCEKQQIFLFQDSLFVKKNFIWCRLNLLFLSLSLLVRAKISRNLKSSLNAISQAFLLERGQDGFSRKGPKLQVLSSRGGLGSARSEDHLAFSTVNPTKRPSSPAEKGHSAFFGCCRLASQVLYHSYLLKDELGIYLYLISKTFFCRFYDI